MIQNDTNYYILPGANIDYRYQTIQENITMKNLKVDINGKKYTTLLLNNEIYQSVGSIFVNNNLSESDKM